MAKMGSSRVILLATAVLVFAGLAAGQQFRYSTIWVSGSTSTVVYGMNDFGTTVGYYETMTGGAFNGFTMTGKVVTTINYPGAYDTVCYGTNNSGAVVGQYLDMEDVFHAFQYQNGTYTNIDPPGAKEAAASGINNVGQIAGSYTDEANGEHGFILQGGTYQTLDVPGAEFTSWAGGINDAGEVTLQWGVPVAAARQYMTGRNIAKFKLLERRSSTLTGSTIRVTSLSCGWTRIPGCTRRPCASRTLEAATLIYLWKTLCSPRATRHELTASTTTLSRWDITSARSETSHPTGGLQRQPSANGGRAITSVHAPIGSI